MATARVQRGSGPRCPNHDVLLLKSDTRGIGICPISGYHFSYQADEDEASTKVKVDSMGRMFEEKTWHVAGDDS